MANGDWGDGGGGTAGDWLGGSSGSAGEFVEVRSRSWFSRVGGALIGALIGVALFFGSFVLLFWNEGRAVKTAQGLAEGRAAVVSIDAGTVDPANDGRLVHLTAEATTDEVLKDPIFGISSRAIRLRRKVEMYQWRERKETSTRRRPGGGEERVTRYHYDRTWQDSRIDSSRFRQGGGHRNPSHWPYHEWTATAQRVAVGAFTLPETLVNKLGRGEPMTVGETEYAALPDDVRTKVRPVGGGFYLGAEPARPRIGDMRITFERIRPQVVSLLARQVGTGFEPFATSRGTTIERLQKGRASAGEMFERAETENRRLTWILRVVGFGVMALGLLLVMNPLAVVADVVPFAGSLMKLGMAFLAFGSAAVLSIATIAIGWMAYRPTLGAMLLAVAAAGLFIFVRAAGRRRAAAAVGAQA